MIREIITYPNKILRQVSNDVVNFDEELHVLLDDMWDTMIGSNGVGLAAIQIAVPLNILIISLPDINDEHNKEDLIEAINPRITHKDGELLFTEGCLSVPGFHEEVKRAEHIIVEYYDRFGTHKTMECEGFLAVAWQHEMDHLDGHLFIEKLSILKRKKFEKDYKRDLKEQKAKNK
jgi:peptide deformylase